MWCFWLRASSLYGIRCEFLPPGEFSLYENDAGSRLAGTLCATSASSSACGVGGRTSAVTVVGGAVVTDTPTDFVNVSGDFDLSPPPPSTTNSTTSTAAAATPITGKSQRSRARVGAAGACSA